jgi:hypothetical protein
MAFLTTLPLKNPSVFNCSMAKPKPSKKIESLPFETEYAGRNSYQQ